MAFTDRALLKQQQAGALGTTGAAAPITEVGKVHEETFVFANVAGSPLAEVAIAMTKAGVVKSIKATPAAALATHAANYVTGTVAIRDGAGGSASTVGAFTTNSTGGAALVQFVPTAVTVTQANAVFAAGNVITYALVDAGTTTEVAVFVSVTVEYI